MRLLPGHCAIQVESIEPIKRGDFVTFGHRGIVEYCIAEVLEGSSKTHHRLRDVDDFCRGFADAVGAVN